MNASTSRRDQAAIHIEAGREALAQNAVHLAHAKLQTAVELEPSWAEPRYVLGLVLIAKGDKAQAEQTIRTALAADPCHAPAAHLLGKLLCDRGSFAEALPWLQTAVVLSPNQAEFLRNLGVLQLFCGDIEGARHTLRRAVEQDPHAESVLATLVRMTQMDSGDSDTEILFDLLRSLVEQSPEMPLQKQVQFLFAFGKALEDRHEYDSAYDVISQANRLHRKTVIYDGGATRTRLNSIAEQFNTSLFERLGKPGRGAQSDRPIFIVGMPRSGTTLVEQIISAHPEVHGGGELNHLHHLVGTARGQDGETYPKWISSMNEVDIRTIGQAFLDRFPTGLPGQRRTTSKRLENFEYIGLIYLCLPNATVINCRRDARDSCWSAFSMPFVMDQEYSYDLTELGTHWREYDRLMAHWSSVLPRGYILDVQYEDLVADQETWTRRILAHCKLDWDDACLRYYDSRRMVRSASMAQVRRPIYDTSVGRWRPFASHLGPLLEALGPPWDQVSEQ